MTTTLPARRAICTTLAVLALALLGAGCGDDDTGAAAPAEPAAPDGDAHPATTLEAVAGDYTFGLSTTTVAAGRVPVELRNDGAEPHQLMVARLHDDVTVDEYVATFERDEATSEALIDFAGGVNAVDPGTTRTGYADLEPGRYVVLCFLPSPEGPSHLHEGMVAELTVVDGASIDDPEPAGEVALTEFGFGLPDGTLGARGAYRVVNEGQVDHELALMRIDDDKTFGDVVAYLAGGFLGERPLAFVGGSGGVEPGADTFVDLDLAPGEYVAMCFLLDPVSGKRHAELGMVSAFTVP